MSEVKKLESEELKSIQDLQKQYNQFIFELGNIEAQIQNVVKTKNTLEVEKQVILEDLTSSFERGSKITFTIIKKFKKLKN
jgi:regulator of replication initiation timing